MVEFKTQIRPQGIEGTQHATGCRDRSIHLRSQERPKSAEWVRLKSQISLQLTGRQTTLTKTERKPGACAEVPTAELFELEQT